MPEGMHLNLQELSQFFQIFRFRLAKASDPAMHTVSPLVDRVDSVGLLWIIPLYKILVGLFREMPCPWWRVLVGYHAA